MMRWLHTLNKRENLGCTTFDLNIVITHRARRLHRSSGPPKRASDPANMNALRWTMVSRTGLWASGHVILRTPNATLQVYNATSHLT
jgi:hypothetical protein